MTNTVPAQHQQSSVASSGVTIAYRRLGTPGRTPLVFVHGLSYFSYDWLDVASRLGTDRECVAIDFKTGERLGASDGRNNGKPVGY